MSNRCCHFVSMFMKFKFETLTVIKMHADPPATELRFIQIIHIQYDSLRQLSQRLRGNGTKTHKKTIRTKTAKIAYPLCWGFSKPQYYWGSNFGTNQMLMLMLMFIHKKPRNYLPTLLEIFKIAHHHHHHHRGEDRVTTSLKTTSQMTSISRP